MTDKHPWTSQYTVTDTVIVAETEQLRVLEITLAPGEAVPWHYHSHIADHFFVTEGRVTVQSRAPRALHDLGPGERCVVAPRTAHRVSNQSRAMSRFLIVQGPGPYDYKGLEPGPPRNRNGGGEFC